MYFKNELLTDEQNEAIERETQMTAKEILDQDERDLNDDIETDDDATDNYTAEDYLNEPIPELENDTELVEA